MSFWGLSETSLLHLLGLCRKRKSLQMLHLIFLQKDILINRTSTETSQWHIKKCKFTTKAVVKFTFRHFWGASDEWLSCCWSGEGPASIWFGSVSSIWRRGDAGSTTSSSWSDGSDKTVEDVKKDINKVRKKLSKVLWAQLTQVIKHPINVPQRYHSRPLLCWSENPKQHTSCCFF